MRIHTLSYSRSTATDKHCFFPGGNKLPEAEAGLPNGFFFARKSGIGRVADQETPMPARSKGKLRRAVKRATKVGGKRRGVEVGTELRTGSEAPSELSGRTLRSSIGFQVRRLRKSIDLTVAELGAAAGISTGMLSKIENGSISPSLGTLEALARALNAPISQLFAETDERRDCSFVKSGAGVRIERRGTKAGHLYDLLGHSLGGSIGVEPYLITLAERAAPYTHFRHAGVEFIYMLSGKVRYRHGDRTYMMEPGDALFFDAAARHGPEDLIELPMHYLSIIIYAREG
jgi:transcriptional regulator with XRE-family HTH domain